MSKTIVYIIAMILIIGIIIFLYKKIKSNQAAATDSSANGDTPIDKATASYEDLMYYGTNSGKKTASA